MSASREKRSRKQQETETVSHKNQKTGMGSVVRTLLIALVIVVVLALFLVGQGVPARYLTALDIAGTSISVAEFDYQYQIMVINFVSSGYASAFGVDTSMPLSRQQYTETMTWGDQFRQEASDSLHDIVARSNAAKAEGLQLTEEDLETMSENIKGLEEAAAAAGMSVKSYLKQNFGRGMDIGVLRTSMERELLAERWTATAKEALASTDAEVQAYYQENINNFDKVTYYSYTIPVEQPEAPEGATEEQIEALREEAMQPARVKAQDLLDAIPPDGESFFREAASKFIADEEERSLFLEEEDSTLKRNQSYAEAGDLQEWLFDPQRRMRDTTVVDTAEGACAVMFVERDNLDYAVRSVRHILIKPEEPDEDGKFTDAAWDKARSRAQEIYDEWKNGAATEDSFAELAGEYTEDEGSKNDGGLYEDVYKGRMVQPFENWLFDAARTSGDTGLVETEHGVHIMYYVSQGENYRLTTVRESKLNAEYRQKEDNLTLSVPEAQRNAFGMLFAQK